VNLSELRPLLERHGIVLTKRFGQNFLVDGNHLRRVVDTAQVVASDALIEVGPGAGSLTRLLAETGATVTTIELDRALLPVLAESLAPYPNVTVVQADALKVALPPANKVVANIPYNITSPLLVRFLERQPVFESLTLMVQKEVAERLTAAPGTENYGALTLFVQFYASAMIAATVPRNAFFPAPKVDSAILHLVPHTTPLVATPAEALFAVTRAAFGQRRKTLRNALSKLAPPEALDAAFAQTGITPQRRGETLSLTEFAALTDALGTDTILSTKHP
jgi:16S rRNA (adenine1518-N6/adenine1519-N6)-dimethyltransferase